jgi:hypothetical protein
MPGTSRVVRLLTILLLLVSTTGGGAMAACARPATASAQTAHHPLRHATHGGMHSHLPAKRSSPPADLPAQPECPVLAMNGGGCTAAADAATLALVRPSTLAAIDASPPAAGVHDRLPADGFFRPPRV